MSRSGWEWATDERAQCPHCLEPIRAGAEVCPHCQRDTAARYRSDGSRKRSVGWWIARIAFTIAAVFAVMWVVALATGTAR